MSLSFGKRNDLSLVPDTHGAYRLCAGSGLERGWAYVGQVRRWPYHSGLGSKAQPTSADAAACPTLRATR